MNRNPVGRAEENLVLEVAKTCTEQLNDLSLKLQQNKEGLSKEDIESFRVEIANLLHSVISSKHIHAKTTEAIESILGQRKEGSDPEDAKRSIKQKIEESTSDYDATKDADYVRITSILKGSDADIDEDFVLIDRGLTDNDIKCPVTAQIFVQPMKNVGGGALPSCIHHISREALNHLCRHKPARCPIGGCRGMWSKDTAVVDLEFERKIQRFLTSKSVAQQAGISHSSSSEDHYTQL